MGKSSTAFGRYSMSGGRFEEAEGLPISVLEELKNYKDLVVDVADHLYKREHPQCKKIAQWFFERNRSSNYWDKARMRGGGTISHSGRKGTAFTLG